ncbi:MAG: NTP transferase domain-containing protein [Kofleriaceae bacterium]
MVEVGAAVVLAAGAGTRLGGVAKALLRVGPDGPTALATIVATAAAAGVPARHVVVVVAAPFAEEVAAAARALGCAVAINPAPARGMASSVAIGFAALAELTPAPAWALLWPVDHPRVRAATVRALVAGLGPSARAVIPTVDGRGGHPVAVAPAAWPALATCAELDGGARAALATQPTARRAVDDAGVVRDVDTPADRAALEAG